MKFLFSLLRIAFAIALIAWLAHDGAVYLINTTVCEKNGRDITCQVIGENWP